MNDKNDQICAGAPALIFPCSGAADVGELSDLAARRLTSEGTGKMFCLAGVGGEVPGIVKTTKEASQILAIDGCPLNCVKLTLEKVGINDIDHIVVTDLGLVKGQSPATDENISIVMKSAEEKLTG